ncbi:TIGR03749 family integrating conjugative element protein [Vibrio pectenicida]|uniref:TIGR03749 family integrating conjugative element protein n=1 Tax=Vibrio pectenicida TaxID=62763 RepID=A0A427U4V0_9VIBR|nr:TIGR03749 family integrating conjugative element protein [Vibrio pectenicida]RSD31709.1 TIGR03749 family integrating conjugative element protein [Vibrio pectenicida]
MIHRCFSALITLLILLSHSAVASTERAMQWQGAPLPIMLKVKQEMIITFDSPVRVAIPSNLKPLLNVMSLGTRVYLTAQSDFGPRRLQVERIHDGQRLLIDVQANLKVNGLPLVTIHFDDAPDVAPAKHSVDKSVELKMDGSALLVRFVMQTLYGPGHAIESLPGVQRSPMGLMDNLALSTFPLWQITAKPIAAWAYQDWVVTAIELTHQGDATLKLDPRQLTLGQGCKLKRCMATFVHPDLGPAHSATKTTTALIATPGPLKNYLYEGASW